MVLRFRGAASGIIVECQIPCLLPMVTVISRGITNAAADRRHLYEWSILTSATVWIRGIICSA